MTNEEAMRICTDMGLHEGGMENWVMDNAWVKFGNIVERDEREECAKLCEELLERPSGYQGRWEGYGKFKSQMTGQECAQAIRERGKA